MSTQTIANWRNKYPEFRDAIQIGVDTFNPRVERALAERAIGFWVTIKEEVRDEKTGKKCASIFHQMSLAGAGAR
jgi:hypothetical protein